MDHRPGLRNKYTTLRHDEARGTPELAGRYLFATRQDAADYARFTTKISFEPGVTFWDRPFFSNVDRHVWDVVGAHEFTPLAGTHHLIRFERWAYTSSGADRLLENAWPAIREDAGRKGLASAWLLLQPDEQLIGLVSLDEVKPAKSPAAESSRLTSLEHLATSGQLLPVEPGPQQVFDRTGVILSMWLPLSREAGVAASSHPLAPLHPEPREHRVTKPLGAAGRSA